MVSTPSDEVRHFGLVKTRGKVDGMLGRGRGLVESIVGSVGRE